MANSQKRSIALAAIVAIIGTLIAVACVQLAQSKAGFVGNKDKLAQRINAPLTPSPIPAAWLISGTPTFRSNTFGNSQDNSSSSGIWECIGPTQFVWHYGTDETIYILEGSADIEYLGKKFTLAAGDSTHFAAGTSANWVVRERIKKTWVLYEPGRLVRVMRRVVG
jgi:uncharacterized protein